MGVAAASRRPTELAATLRAECTRYLRVADDVLSCDGDCSADELADQYMGFLRRREDCRPLDMPVLPARWLVKDIAGVTAAP